MNVLIPVQYPLTDANERAIRRGRELVAGHENPELLVFHMNEIHKDRHISRESLREAVEALFEGIEASYVVRDGFFVEEAIIEEAIRLNMEYIVLSKSRRDRWTRLLAEILDVDRDLERLVREQTGIEVVVVTDVDPDSADA